MILARHVRLACKFDLKLYYNADVRRQYELLIWLGKHHKTEKTCRERIGPSVRQDQMNNLAGNVRKVVLSA